MRVRFAGGASLLVIEGQRVQYVTFVFCLKWLPITGYTNRNSRLQDEPGVKAEANRCLTFSTVLLPRQISLIQRIPDLLLYHDLLCHLTDSEARYRNPARYPYEKCLH